MHDYKTIADTNMRDKAHMAAAFRRERLAREASRAGSTAGARLIERLIAAFAPASPGTRAPAT